MRNVESSLQRDCLIRDWILLDRGMRDAAKDWIGMDFAGDADVINA